MFKQHYMRLANMKAVLFAYPQSKWFWLVVRLYLASIWLMAGFEKLKGDAWVGPNAGAALTGFVKGALMNATGQHPDVLGWYEWFLQHAVLSIPAFWANLVTFGELAVGLGLLFGILTTGAAIGGAFMNYNFLLAGSVGVNPIMLPLEIGLAFAWRVSSKIGLCHVIRKCFSRTKST